MADMEKVACPRALSRATPTKVTYFRTGLDRFDGCRMADIFSGDGGDMSTPAAVLSTHLREVNPAVSWCDDVERKMERGLEDNMLMRLDAVTFEHAYGAHVIAAIKICGNSDYISSRHFSITTSQQFRDSTYALATSFELERPRPAAGTIRIKGRKAHLDGYVAENLATRTARFEGNDTRLNFFTTLNDQGVSQLDPPHLPGFDPVSWDSRRWRNLYGEILGTHAVDDIASRNSVPIVSSIAQGAGYVPLVELWSND